MTTIDIPAIAGTELPQLDMNVSRVSLRCALAAVLPHVGDTDSTHRIRLALADERTLIVMATSSYTAITARAHVIDVIWSSEMPVIDIEPRSAREILSVFAPPADKDERSVWEHNGFRVRVTDTEVTVIESAGMLDDLDRVLTVPRLRSTPADDKAPRFPDLARLVLRNLLTQPSVQDRARVSVKRLEPFIKSAKAYGIPDLTLRTFETVHGLIVHVSEDAVGIVSGSERAPDAEAEQAENLADLWQRQLAPLFQPITKEGADSE
ncbi:hypothetical protein GCM10010401_14090 [Rarobacter faecitabidus]|uniref:DNA polymerase-3 subunit beta n=1 Tax=Rarobacter faecitabidus TaxID=13243 RepID=A0A542ZDX1_RARFA|nr:hypothetical protein [Rarobacter faecitabidus]TQL58545.1 hypothetical protein FB461_1960 [Rarobacter faecitabidus]